MTKAYRLVATLVATLVTLSFTACDSDTPNPQEEVTVGYDLWVPIDGATGQSTANTDPHIIARVADLTKGVFSIKGEGAETSASPLTPYVVYHKGYYYSVSREGRFGKFRVSNTGIETIKEFPMPQILDRRFSHAWLDDNTLVMVSSVGDKQEMSWVKVDVNKMVITAEGKLDLPKPEEGEIFNSSGLLGYRKADNTLIYPHVYMEKSKKTSMALPPKRNEIYIAFIDATTMQVKKIDKDTRCEHLSSTSFGETRCQKTFFDSKGNFYFAAATCNIPENAKKSSTKQRSFLFRVNAGSMETDKSFDGYAQPRGKIITVFPLNDDEVLLYMQDPDFKEKGNTDWSSKTNRYIYYWLRCNIKTQQVEHIKDIPFSNGNYGQLAVRNGNTVSIGANVEGAPTTIYQYNINTRKVTKGATLADGFELDRITPVVKE
ncbi:hypothetical protein [Porphyromonas asaccharolytica]